MEPTNTETPVQIQEPVQPVNIQQQPVTPTNNGVVPPAKAKTPTWVWVLVGCFGGCLLLVIVWVIVVFVISAGVVKQINDQTNALLSATVTPTVSTSVSATPSQDSLVTYVKDLCSTIGNGGSLSKWFNPEVQASSSDLKSVEALMKDCYDFTPGTSRTINDKNLGTTYEQKGTFTYADGTKKDVTVQMQLTPSGDDYVVSYINVG